MDSEWLEELSSALVSLELHDPRSRAELESALSSAAAAATRDGERAQLRRLHERFLGEPSEDSVAAIATFIQSLTGWQPRAPRAQPGAALALPAEIDDELFSAFLSEQRLLADELVELGEQLARNDSEALGELKRRLHSLKGEAGVVGLLDVESLCHRLETLLSTPDSAWVRSEQVALLREWLEGAIASYARHRHPTVTVDMLFERLERVGIPQHSVSEIAAAPLPPAPAVPPAVRPGRADRGSTPAPKKAARRASDEPQEAPDVVAAPAPSADLADVELVSQFLEESEEGLAKVDELLLELEASGPDHERINGVFRVFHTIKGVSAFLSLADVTQLAHHTETLLDKVRSGTLEATSGFADLVFDATSLLRRLLADVRASLGGRALESRTPEVTELVDRLDAAANGGLMVEDAVEPAQPEERLGQILKRRGVIDEETVERALELQRDTGVPMGQVLIRHTQAPPKEVAHALRAQKQVQQQPSMKLRELVKVDLERVDRLVETIGELVIVESMVAHAPDLSDLTGPVRNYLAQLAKITRELQELGLRMRTVAVRSEFQKLGRIVRDLGRKSGKLVRLQVNGEGTEMDRNLVEQVADPLLHLIRNAVDHGIEPADQRRAAGKPPTGTITLSAYHEGDGIVIEVVDDGKGIDRAAVLAKAIARGLVSRDERLDDAAVLDLIFLPGFSTAAQVTEISGRGVGMDVVKRNVEAVRGRIQVKSEPGTGTSFRLVLPLTLAIIDGMVIRCGEEHYILPTLSIVESLQPRPAMLKTLTGRRELVEVRGEMIPLLRMASLLEVAGAEADPCRALVVILESARGRVGLLVDEVVNQQQVVTKHMGTNFEDSSLFSGAAILSDGRVGLIIDVAELVALADPRAKQRPNVAQQLEAVAPG